MRNMEKNIIIPSILDQLIDHSPSGDNDAGLQTIEQYKASIRRDLENLLNSRPSFSLWPADLQELKSSLINYGIADFMTKSKLNEREVLRQQIETAIRHFEPRLLNPCVKILKSGPASNRSGLFEIEATLMVRGIPESLSFHSRIGLNTGTFFIQDYTS